MLPKLKITFERWKWNSEHEVYVSTEGRIKDSSGDIIEPMLNKSGYLVFFSEVKQAFSSIHRLVLETWRPREDMQELTVEHKDQNKRNPALRNLIWLTSKENLRRAIYHDLAHSRKEETLDSVKKYVRANGVTMTIEDAVTFIYALPSTSAQYSKAGVRQKIEETLKSNKQKKAIFGVELEEII